MGQVIQIKKLADCLMVHVLVCLRKLSESMAAIWCCVQYLRKKPANHNGTNSGGL